MEKTYFLKKIIKSMSSQAEISFRESLKTFSTRSTTSTHVPTSRGQYFPVPSLDNLSFPSWSNNTSSHTPSLFQDDFCGLGRLQRYTAFLVLMGLALFCFMIAFMTLPMLVVFPAKFAISYSMGSLISLFSVALLKGFRAHFYHLISKERILFTGLYLGSMIATLVAALGSSHHYILTIFFSLVQMVALFWYLTSYLPFSMFSRVSSLPI